MIYLVSNILKPSKHLLAQIMSSHRGFVPDNTRSNKIATFQVSRISWRSNRFDWPNRDAYATFLIFSRHQENPARVCAGMISHAFFFRCVQIRARLNESSRDEPTSYISSTSLLRYLSCSFEIYLFFEEQKKNALGIDELPLIFINISPIIPTLFLPDICCSTFLDRPR